MYGWQRCLVAFSSMHGLHFPLFFAVFFVNHGEPSKFVPGHQVVPNMSHSKRCNDGHGSEIARLSCNEAVARQAFTR